MIILRDNKFHTIKMFKTEGELLDYLKKQESFKNSDGQSRYNWGFSRYSHKLLATCVKEMKDMPFAYMASQAVQQECDLIVICKGDWEKPSLFLVTLDLDIAALQKDWNEHYCAAHGMSIWRGSEMMVFDRLLQKPYENYPFLLKKIENPHLSWPL
ncbi:MAG: hypothetical protein K0R52_445 [Alphaproteobacteria bacterium]|nr:hypothetical protein [Alphaproteobacteria bacterium]